MEIINKKSILEINKENEKLQAENKALISTVANLKLENNKKDMIAKNLMQQIAEVRLEIMKIKGGN